MDETRIRILIEKHRQHLTKKVEEALGRAGEEWAAQAAELHILRADAENRRKEGRGFCWETGPSEWDVIRSG